MSTSSSLRLLTEQQVSEMLAISLSRLRQDRMRGIGLPYHKFGRSIRYSYSDVMELLNHTRVNPWRGRDGEPAK